MVQVPNWDVIYTHIMLGYDDLMADGVIGLGYIDPI